MKTTTNPGKKLTKIDAQFIDELKKERGIIHWNFDNEKKQIVPTELTHDELMLNNVIHKNIFKYYFLPTSKMLTDAEFREMVNGGHGGKRETFLTPYPFSINGAYYSRQDLVTKLSLLMWRDEKPYLNGNNNLENFEDLIPYFKEYAEGFENGYNEFENECIKPFLPMFPDKQDFINKVFEYVTKRIFFRHDWLNNHSGFATDYANDPESGNIVNAFEDGQKQGYFYKAWGIVFSNNALFAPLFQTYKTSPSPQKKRPGKPSATVKPAEHYLQNISLEERKKVFLEELKKTYKGCKPKTFGHLIRVLQEKGYLNMTSNIEIQKSFEKAIEPVSQSKTSFNKWMNNTLDPDLKKSIKDRIEVIIKEKLVV